MAGSAQVQGAAPAAAQQSTLPAGVPGAGVPGAAPAEAQLLALAAPAEVQQSAPVAKPAEAQFPVVEHMPGSEQRGQLYRLWLSLVQPAQPLCVLQLQ